ncbi:MAG: hypothetical protein HYU70_16345 [Bacteroidetes bacterium]|nr:hypothetical protein [Bacteroidota bacterium]
MKNLKLTVAFFLWTTCTTASAQQQGTDEQKGKFKQENIFLGTSLNLGIANRSFNVGLNPEVGYSVTRWLDAGVSLNINYFSQNASDFSNIRFRNFNFGGGPFLRVWPLSFLHFQVQPEYNWISSSQKNVVTGQSGTYKYNAGSLLVGVGYGTRVLGSHYSYVTLMIDVMQNLNSPYRDQYNDPLPVFRAGFGMYLKPRRR